MEEFQAQAKARFSTPEAMQKVTEQNAALKKQLVATKESLAAERERDAALVRIATELALELEQARAELASAQQVSQLPAPRTPRISLGADVPGPSQFSPRSTPSKSPSPSLGTDLVSR